MGNSLAAVELKDLAPVRADERKELNLARKVTHKQFKKHIEGDFSETCLLEIPWSVRDSISLYEKFDGSFNRITDIPVELPMRLPHLSDLNLSHNQLTYLPESFGFLFHLQSVTLRYNNIKELPKSFLHLVKLARVDLSHNALRELPEDIGMMESLQRLNVCDNKLKELPLSLGQLHTLTVLLAKNNRLVTPPQSLCNEGSSQTISYLRRNVPGGFAEPVVRTVNIFPRVRGNLHQHQNATPNSQAAILEYMQSQAATANTAVRIKTPLIPPLDATTLDALELRDRVIGLVYGAAVGEALGVATSYMTPDECQFYYDPDTLTYSDIVRDDWRTHWRQGDWANNFDIMMLVLDSLLQWGGVVDELDFAKRISDWLANGYKELGDTETFCESHTIIKVVHEPTFLKDPHQSARSLVDKLHSVEENDEIKDLFADNSGLCSVAVLGLARFHDLDEVVSNATRICKSTHADPRCLAAATVVGVLVALLLQGRHNLDDASEVENMIDKARNVALAQLTEEDHVTTLNTYTRCDSIDSINIREASRMEFVMKPLACAVTSLRLGKDFRSSLTSVLMEGGSSHTNCCLTGALLGCKTGFSRLPHAWPDGLRRRQQEWLNVKVNLLCDMMGLP